MNIDNNKAKGKMIKFSIVFYEDEPKENTFGSDTIAYEIYYFYDGGIMQVDKIEAFGDRTLMARYKDRRGRGITEDEMLENIKQISNMTYKEFKQKISKED